MSRGAAWSVLLLLLPASAINGLSDSTNCTVTKIEVEPGQRSIDFLYNLTCTDDTTCLNSEWQAEMRTCNINNSTKPEQVKLKNSGTLQVAKQWHWRLAVCGVESNCFFGGVKITPSAAITGFSSNDGLKMKLQFKDTRVDKWIVEVYKTDTMNLRCKNYNHLDLMNPVASVSFAGSELDLPVRIDGGFSLNSCYCFRFKVGRPDLLPPLKKFPERCMTPDPEAETGTERPSQAPMTMGQNILVAVLVVMVLVSAVVVFRVSMVTGINRLIDSLRGAPIRYASMVYGVRPAEWSVEPPGVSRVEVLLVRSPDLISRDATLLHHLHTVAQEVHEVHKIGTEAERLADANGWLLHKLLQPHVRVVVVLGPDLTALLSPHGGVRKAAPAPGKLDQLSEDQLKFTLNMLMTPMLYQDYSRVFVVRPEGCQEPVTVLETHRCYHLPHHLPRLLQDLRSDSCPQLLSVSV